MRFATTLLSCLLRSGLRHGLHALLQLRQGQRQAGARAAAARATRRSPTLTVFSLRTLLVASSSVRRWTGWARARWWTPPSAPGCVDRPRTEDACTRGASRTLFCFRISLIHRPQVKRFVLVSSLLTNAPAIGQAENPNYKARTTTRSRLPSFPRHLTLHPLLFAPTTVPECAGRHPGREAVR
jgi:hypothetical protein